MKTSMKEAFEVAYGNVCESEQLSDREAQRFIDGARIIAAVFLELGLSQSRRGRKIIKKADAMNPHPPEKAPPSNDFSPESHLSVERCFGKAQEEMRNKKRGTSRQL